MRRLLRLSRDRSVALVGGVMLLASSLAATGTAAVAAPPAIHGRVRVDQVGYATGEPKRAC